MNPYSKFADWLVEKITIPNPEYGKRRVDKWKD